MNRFHTIYEFSEFFNNNKLLSKNSFTIDEPVNGKKLYESLITFDDLSVRFIGNTSIECNDGICSLTIGHETELELLNSFIDYKQQVKKLINSVNLDGCKTVMDKVQRWANVLSLFGYEKGTHNLYHAFTEQKINCAVGTVLTLCFLKKNGIGAVRSSGFSSEEGGHTWVIFKLNGELISFECTSFIGKKHECRIKNCDYLKRFPMKSFNGSLHAVTERIIK